MNYAQQVKDAIDNARRDVEKKQRALLAARSTLAALERLQLPAKKRARKAGRA